MAKNITTDTQQYSRKKKHMRRKSTENKSRKQAFRLYSESSINIYCSFNFISIFWIDLNLRLSFSVSTRFNAVFKIEISISSWQNRARKKNRVSLDKHWTCGSVCFDMVFHHFLFSDTCNLKTKTKTTSKLKEKEKKFSFR